MIRAETSATGRRVVTASGDHTARVWDAGTGKPVGGPLQHEGAVNSAVFSPDGRRVATASQDRTARVWTVLLDSGSSQDAALMAGFAEALGGYRVNEFGSPVPLENQFERLDELRHRLAQGPDREGAPAWFLRRLLAIRQ